MDTDEPQGAGVAALAEDLEERLAEYFNEEFDLTGGSTPRLTITRRALAHELASTYPLSALLDGLVLAGDELRSRQRQRSQAEVDAGQIVALRRAVCELYDELSHRSAPPIDAYVSDPAALFVAQLALEDRAKGDRS